MITRHRYSLLVALALLLSTAVVRAETAAASQPATKPANAETVTPASKPATKPATKRPIEKKPAAKKPAAKKPASPALLATDDDDDDDWGDDDDAKKSKPSKKAKSDDDDDDDEDQGPKLELHGFVESATSLRLAGDPTTNDQLILGEARFRLEARHAGDIVSLSFKGDFLADGATEAISVDIREAVVSFRLFSFMDVKAGRQVLTWGTGDLLFLNDLFPKDWVSFIGGRADEYLKAPSTSVKIALYSSIVNLDLVWTPIFEPDRFITGERLSLFFPLGATGPGLVGGGEVIQPLAIDRRLKNGEFHGRLHRTIAGLELALYGYLGYFKQPLAGAIVDPGPPPQFSAKHSRLAVYGASVRGTLLGGIFNVETGFYHSLDDKDGTDPFIPNHHLRSLVGYEHELVSKMTLGLQYYNEYTLQHDKLETNSPFPQFEPLELRHVVTLRWMYRLLRDDLVLGLFAFYSPNEKDFYLRPKIEYKVSDALKLAAGANILWGDDQHTFFGMLQENTNVYARARYVF
jgi:hypothetical protein